MLWKEWKAKQNWEPFDRYRVRLRLKHIVGGLPAVPEIIKTWVETRNADKTAEEQKLMINAHIDELPEVADEVAEKKTIVFPRVGGQLAIEGRQVKAMLKEAANVVKNSLPRGCGKDGKIAALKSKVAETVFVEEEYISLGRAEPDEVIERPISVVTRQGPRTSIKRCEVCRDVEIEFHLRRLRGGEVSEAVLLAILEYAQQMGLGADRSQGRGVFEVVDVEKQS